MTDTSDLATDSTIGLRFLQQAARLLLEYNMRTALIERRLRGVAEALRVPMQVSVAYRQITLHTPGTLPALVQVPELRINVAISARVNRILDDVCAGRLDAQQGLAQLSDVEQRAERHNRWLLCAMFGAAAMALAVLLAGDWQAVVVIDLASAAGLVARQQLAKRHVLLFALPLTAAFIGSLAGGLLILLGGTSTPGICLIVPALMLVPGPHFINGLYDIIENNMATGLPRIALAAGILLSAAMGIFLGAWLMLGLSTVPPWAQPAYTVPLWADVLLAGIAACGFGAVYNAPWRVLWTSIACGMLGHGIRYVSLEQGWTLALSTMLGCMAIGALATRLSGRLGVPFAAVAFAGAVPMMPGVLMFLGLAGAMEIAFAGGNAPPALLASTLSDLLQAGVVVAAMGLGLMIGARGADVLRFTRPAAN